MVIPAAGHLTGLRTLLLQLNCCPTFCSVIPLFLWCWWLNWGPHIHVRQPFYNWALGLSCNNCWVPNLINNKIKRKRRHQAQAKTLKIWRPKQYKFCRIEAKRYPYLSSLIFISLIFRFLLMDFLPEAYSDGISILFFLQGPQLSAGS